MELYFLLPCHREQVDTALQQWGKQIQSRDNTCPAAQQKAGVSKRAISSASAAKENAGCIVVERTISVTLPLMSPNIYPVQAHMHPPLLLSLHSLIQEAVFQVSSSPSSRKHYSRLDPPPHPGSTIPDQSHTITHKFFSLLLYSVATHSVIPLLISLNTEQKVFMLHSSKISSRSASICFLDCSWSM